MSLCSAEEIAEKRRIALERLNARKQETTTKTASSPVIAKNPPATGNNAASFLGAFRNSSNPVRQLNQARISAQPYPKQAPLKTQPSSAFQQNKAPELAPIFLPNNIRAVHCRCAMVTATRFGVYMSEYHGKAIDVCKTIPSRSYDGDRRLWTFDLKQYELVMERFEGLKPNVVLEGIHKRVLDIFREESRPNGGSMLSYMASISEPLRESLLPFQKEGVKFGISKQGRVLIADEMGLGKTYQALALADFYKEDWPLLIATTASTRDVWLSQVRKLLTFVNCHHIACITASQECFDDAKIVISSYPMLEKCLEKLESMHFGVLIMDESHTLKNFKSKCTKVADRLAKKAKRVILLSGTPALSRPVELFSQLKMLDRGFLNYMDYTVRYCEGKAGNFGWDASGQSNLDELKVILCKKFMIRRTKAEVLPELAEKNRETVYLDPALISQSLKLRHFSKIASQYMTYIKEEDLIQYYAETGRVKCEAICSYLKGIVKEKIKFIIFAHHKCVLDAICECLKSLKVQHIRIDGSTKNEIRAEKIEKFQTKPKCRAAVLSIRACNAGISLTAAQLILFAELDWNPSTLAQAESRAHRIGQENEVICRYLLARDTADDIIWRKLQNKQDVLNKAGLFSEDLRNSEHIVGPNSSGNIDKYIVKTPRKTNPNSLDVSTSSDDDNRPAQLPQNMSETNEQNANNDSFENLLNDGDDDDFANIDF